LTKFLSSSFKTSEPRTKCCAEVAFPQGQFNDLQRPLAASHRRAAYLSFFSKQRPS
jgi:hypothetical protein